MEATLQKVPLSNIQLELLKIHTIKAEDFVKLLQNL